MKSTYAPFLLVAGFLSACSTSPYAPTPVKQQLASTTTRTITLPEIREKYSTPASKFVDIDGTELHYQESGSGPVVLLIHGTLGDVGDWAEWTERLGSHYRVVSLDLPGFGLSADIPNGNYSIDKTLSIIDAFMHHLDAPSFAVVGISYGGIISFRYAATRVDRVSALVLINSAGIQTGKRPSSGKKPRSSAAPSKAKNIFVDTNILTEDVEQFYEAYINDPERRSGEFIQRKLDFLNVVGRDEVARKALSFYERGNPTQTLSHVKAPSLVLWGGGNQALDTTTANAFIAALNSACFTRLTTFQKGGHYINVESPKETAEAASAFFVEVASAYEKNNCGNLRVTFAP